MRTFLLRVAVVLTLAVTLAPATATARPPAPPRPPQDQAEIQRLFEQAGFVEIDSAREVSVEEVAAQAAEAEGISPAEALARVTGADGPDALAAATCQAVEYSTHRGVFPYHRWVQGQTTWCYEYGGVITYRASHTSARVNGVCTGSNPRSWRVAGGAGQSWVIVHHEADFSCATPWWYRLNDTLWLEVQFDSHGNASITRSS